MSGANSLANDVDIDLAGLFGEIRKKLWLILALPLLSGVALLVFLSGMQPSYRSNAQIIIEKRESVFTRRKDGDFTLSANQFDEQAVGSQVQVLNSDELAIRVITKLKLADRKEFSSSKPSIIADFLALAGLGGSQLLDVSPQERVLNAFRLRLRIYAVEKSRVIAIEFWAHDRKLAQEVPNAIADEFLALTKASQLQTTEDATDWLGPEIEQLRAKVRDAEAKVAAFRANSDILVGNNNALLSTQQLSEFSSELSRVKSDRSAAEGKIASIQAAIEQGGSLDVIPEVLASALIQRLREREASLQAQISELGTSLLANHPRLKALKSQAADFQSQIRNAAKNILVSLENNVDLQRKQEAVLLQEVIRLKAESARAGEAEVELRALEREANAQRELLEVYLTQFREAASRTNGEYLPIDARIISRATLPAESYFPKVVSFTLAGTFVTLVMTIVGVLAAALFSGRAFKQVGAITAGLVRDPLELPQAALRPVAADAPVHARAIAKETSSSRQPAVLPHLDAPPMTGDEFGPASDDAYGQADQHHSAANDPEVFLLDEAVQAVSGLGHARIAAISPGGDGGSVIAREMARRLADDGHAVVIVDLTGSAVTSLELLGNAPLAGLSELLAGTASLADVVYHEKFSQLHVVPAGLGTDAGPSAMHQLIKLADQLASTYDFAVFDCGLEALKGWST